MEFLVTMTTHVPDGTSDAAVEEARASPAHEACDVGASTSS